jgi:segregation and condensation protein B
MDGQSNDDLGLDQFDAISDDQGLSLEELSRAYAELMGKGQDPYEAPPETESDEREAAPPAEIEPPSDDACALSPLSILEAILFVGHPANRPLESGEIAALMRGVRPQEIADLIVELNNRYQQEGCPYWINAVGPGFRLELRPKWHPLRDKFYGRIRAARLTQAAVDVLAVVAYNQPIARDDIDKIRGKPSGAVLSQLLQRQLLRVERTVVEGRRRSQYSTTERFLALFGLTSLDELPHDIGTGL